MYVFPPQLECQDLWKGDLGGSLLQLHRLQVWQRSRPGLHFRRGGLHYHSSLAASRIPEGVSQVRFVIFAII